MKKLPQLAIAALLTAGMFTGTTYAAPAEEAVEAAEIAEVGETVPEDDIAQSEESVFAEATEEEEAENAPQAEVSVGMPNPLIEYPDVPALERAIGFPVFYLPSNFYSLYHPAEHVFCISGQVADLRFCNVADNTSITVRCALEERVRTTDISGVHGAAWTTQSAGDVNRTKVDVATLADGARAVRWKHGRFVFAIYVTGFDDTAFKPLLKSFVAVSSRFAHKYRHFTLNTKRNNRNRKAEATTDTAQNATQNAAQNTAQTADATAQATHAAPATDAVPATAPSGEAK